MQVVAAVAAVLHTMSGAQVVEVEAVLGRF